jgi:hypothetical protein
MPKKIEIGFLIFLFCLIAAVSGCTSSTVTVYVNYSGDWNGTITDSSGTRTIEGTGNQTFDLGSITGSLSAKVEKKDNKSDPIFISAVRGGKVVASQNTTNYPSLTDAQISVYLTN